jgi:hypothetical protein
LNHVGKKQPGQEKVAQVIGREGLLDAVRVAPHLRDDLQPRVADDRAEAFLRVARAKVADRSAAGDIEGRDANAAFVCPGACHDRGFRTPSALLVAAGKQEWLTASGEHARCLEP